MKYKKNTHHYIFIISLLVLTLLPIQKAQAQMRWNQAYQNYIDQYKELAIRQMQKYHIPASITLAQGLFESGAGLGKLAKNFNNHFGIKCHNWTGNKTYHDDDEQNECFRAYDDPKESYEDHSIFLRNNQRYASLFTLNQNDYKAWAYGLKRCGYATNPAYPQKLIQIIELYHLNELDKGSKDKFIEHHSGFDVAQDRLHPIKMFNKNYYLLAREGDTFKSIGKEVDISWRKLARYNERDKKDVLHEGDIIFLKKKRSKAPKTFKNVPHVVKPGESMYLISQRYGIKLKSLYKMNNLSPTYQIYPGAKLKVR